MSDYKDSQNIPTLKQIKIISNKTEQKQNPEDLTELRQSINILNSKNDTLTKQNEVITKHLETTILNNDKILSKVEKIKEKLSQFDIE